MVTGGAQVSKTEDHSVSSIAVVIKLLFLTIDLCISSQTKKHISLFER